MRTTASKMPTATRAEFVARCEELGVSFEIGEEAIDIVAPDGMVFSGNENHRHTVWWNAPPGAWKKGEAYAALMDDMSMGVEECPFRPNCECCDCED